jgi:hydroxypyruvate reductase
MEISPSIRGALDGPIRPPVRARRPANIVIGKNSSVIHAAGEKANALGFVEKIVTSNMQGEAREVGQRFGQRLKRIHKRGTRGAPVCLLMGGETTVTVRGQGLGGRNQELALAAAIALENTPGTALMSLATDGVDGPTDAAGAVITGETAAKAEALGFSPREALKENDAYPLLEATAALLRTGPTGTNLNDLVVGLVY